MDLEQAKQIVNKNRDKKLTENQIKEVIALAELLASCTIINLKKGIKNEKCNTLREGLHR
jgi:agmatine/peptidylarginine deiminase